MLFGVGRVIISYQQKGVKEMTIRELKMFCEMMERIISPDALIKIKKLGEVEIGNLYSGHFRIGCVDHQTILILDARD